MLLYAPTWVSDHHDDALLPISEQLLAKYNVIFKGHVESDRIAHLPDGVILPQKVLKHRTYYLFLMLF